MGLSTSTVSPGIMCLRTSTLYAAPAKAMKIMTMPAWTM